MLLFIPTSTKKVNKDTEARRKAHNYYYVWTHYFEAVDAGKMTSDLLHCKESYEAFLNAVINGQFNDYWGIGITGDVELQNIVIPVLNKAKNTEYPVDFLNEHNVEFYYKNFCRHIKSGLFDPSYWAPIYR